MEEIKKCAEQNSREMNNERKQLSNESGEKREVDRQEEVSQVEVAVRTAKSEEELFRQSKSVKSGHKQYKSVR